jgi:hypothetical protein
MHDFDTIRIATPVLYPAAVSVLPASAPLASLSSGIRPLFGDWNLSPTLSSSTVQKDHDGDDYDSENKAGPVEIHERTCAEQQVLADRFSPAKVVLIACDAACQGMLNCFYTLCNLIFLGKFLPRMIIYIEKSLHIGILH